MKYDKGPLIYLSFWCLVTLAWWGLAFYPSAPTTGWVEVARKVCFGVLDNGLPDTYGWLLLIFAPSAFLLVLVVTWKKDLLYGIIDLTKQKLGVLGLVILAGLVFLEATWVIKKFDYARQISFVAYASESNLDLPEDYFRTKKKLPNFSLIDQHGNRISPLNHKGEILILTFAFAHCQTVCPMIVRTAVDAFEKVADPNVRLLIITLDPWRDTPAALPSLAKKWDLPSNAHVLSEKIDVVNAVIESFSIPAKRSDSNGDIQHPALTYVIDQDGYIAYTFNNASVKWLEQAISRIRNSHVTSK